MYKTSKIKRNEVKRIFSFLNYVKAILELKNKKFITNSDLLTEFIRDLKNSKQYFYLLQNKRKKK